MDDMIIEKEMNDIENVYAKYYENRKYFKLD